MSLAHGNTHGFYSPPKLQKLEQEKMKRIKIFLGGYVNYLNAQNINCRSLSEHLDQNKFNISTMLHPAPNAADFCKTTGVKYIQLRLPARFWRYLVYLKGIAFADVAYLPKGEITAFCKFIGFIFRTKLFTTIEGLLGEPSQNKKHKAYIRNFARFSPNIYSITKFLAKKESQRHGLNISNCTLPLGVEYRFFACNPRGKEKLQNIIFIGNKLITKGIYEFLEVSTIFPEINFHIVGKNDLGEKGSLTDYLKDGGYKNITYHGVLNHSDLSKLLPTMQLMYFPSRSEGFPKVQLEAASCGVPTLCYPDYGADEWIDSSVNGIIVNSIEEAIEEIKKLQTDPIKLHSLSLSVVKLAQKFDWMRVIKIWESEIANLCKK